MSNQKSYNTHKPLFFGLFSLVGLLFVGSAVFMLAWPMSLSNAANDQDVALSNSLITQNPSKEVEEKIKELQIAQKEKYEKQQAKSATTSTKTQTTTKTTNTTNKTKSASVSNQKTQKYMSGTKLKIPASGTVLTLSGLNFNLYNDQPKKFQGIFSKPPYKMIKVNYPASIASNSIKKGVLKLDALLKTTPGTLIVLAQSQGAQVASHWMREHANDPEAPSAKRLTFILTGNPLRSTGGYAIGKKEIGGTIGQPTPTYTKWSIIDVARRYDGWADWVKDEGNSRAVKNADAGKRSLHLRYDEVDIKDPTHTIWKKGNTTYVLTQEKVLPMWEDTIPPPESVISQMRAHIESAYIRPKNDPKVEVIPTESWFWRTVMKVWGILD